MASLLLPLSWLALLLPPQNQPVTVAESSRVKAFPGWRVEEVRYTPDGKMLLVIITKKVEERRAYRFLLLDAATGAEKYELLQLDAEKTVFHYSMYPSFSPDGKCLTLRYNQLRFILKEGKWVDQEWSRLHVFDLTTGKELWRRDLPEGIGTGTVIPYLDGGKTVLTGHGVATYREEQGTRKQDWRGSLRAWDVATGEARPVPQISVGYVSFQLEYSPDRRYLAVMDIVNHKETGKRQDRLTLWDMSVQPPRMHLQFDNAGGEFAPDGKRFLTSQHRGGDTGFERDLALWDLASGKELARTVLPLGKRTWVKHHLWSADGRWLDLITTGGECFRWDMTGKAPLARTDALGLTTEVRAQREGDEVAYHAGAKLLAFGLHGMRQSGTEEPPLPPPLIYIVDAERFQKTAALAGHQGRIHTMTFSPDGRTLLSGGSDGTLRWWGVKAK